MAIRFDSTASDGLTLTSAGVSTSVFSILGWFYLTVDTNAYTEFWALGTTLINDYVSLGTTNDGTTLTMTNWDSEWSGTPLVLGKWYFLAFTKNGSAWKTYIATLNDMKVKLDISATVTQTFSTNTLSVGIGGATNGINGRIANIMVYNNVELSIQQIQAQALSSVPLYTHWLHTWLKMSPGATNRAIDFSPAHRVYTVGGTLTDEAGPNAPSAIAFPWYVLPDGVSPVVISCTVGALSLGEPSATVVPGGVNIGCAVGALALSEQAVSVVNVPPPVSVACAVGTLTLGEASATIVPGGVNIACAVGALALGESSATIVPGVGVGSTTMWSAFALVTATNCRSPASAMVPVVNPSAVAVRATAIDAAASAFNSAAVAMTATPAIFSLPTALMSTALLSPSMSRIDVAPWKNRRTFPTHLLCSLAIGIALL
jgi:hypothetical protein